MIPPISIVLNLPSERPRCRARLYDGTQWCVRGPDHEGPHEIWEDHGDRCALAYRWYDCPVCGRSCAVAALGLWGYCPVCWDERQPRCEHGLILGGHCSRCDARDADQWRRHKCGGRP